MKKEKKKERLLWVYMWAEKDSFACSCYTTRDKSWPWQSCFYFSVRYSIRRQNIALEMSFFSGQGLKDVQRERENTAEFMFLQYAHIFHC